MLLDLWSFAIILNDILEFVIYWAEHETFTVSFGLATLTFFILAYFAWRSTDIPHDVPSPPRPPFIITIQGTSLNNGGRRQSLSDVHILRSTSTYTPRSDITRRSTSTSTALTVDAGVQVLSAPQPQVSAEAPPRQHPPSPILRPSLHGTRSLFFGLLRRRAVTRPILPTRPLLRTRFSQGPNLVVYHRIYHPSSTLVSPLPAPVVLPSANSSTDNSVSTPTSTADSTSSAHVENSDVVVPNPSESVLVNFESSSDNSNASSASPAEESTTGIPQVDPCRVLERSYSDSDLELAYSSELTSDMGNNEKSDGVQSPAPNMTSVDPQSSNDVKFTLKFLNDTQKDVTTQCNEKVIDFKRRHFATELNENKIVRLIFNGRVLDNDNKTLQESGIFDQCVVHCLIVTPQPSQQSQGGGQPTQRYGSRSGPRGPEPGMFFVSFMGIILVFLWFICFNFGQQLFTQSAVVSLSVLTAIFLIGLVAFYLPVHPANPNPN